jgi:hypothetical protein
MRTTVEITDEQHARLVELAARRREKGFSKLVGEALNLFLDNQGHRHAVSRALAVRGALSEEEASQMTASVKKLRGTWRS